MRSTTSKKTLIDQLLNKEVEPEFTELNSDKIDLINALNYYSRHKTQADSKKYALEYINARLPELNGKLTSVHEDSFKNIGFLCRMIGNGFSDADVKGRAEHHLVSMYKTTKHSVKNRVTVKRKPVQLENTMLELVDYAIDAVLESKEHESITATANKAHREEVAKRVNDLQAEIKEFPECFPKKTELNKFCKSIIDLLTKAAIVVKKQRVKKVAPKKVDHAKMIAGLKLAQRDETLAMNGKHARQLIAATRAVVWHPERRTLTSYIAIDDGGFLISGRSLKNFDPEKSITKKIRKPEEMWSTIKEMTATKMHIWLRDTCKTTACEAKALLPDGSVLIKV